MNTPKVTAPNRAAWSDCSKLHTAAVMQLGQMEQEAFWNWYHDEAMKIANKHDNGALILALLLAVFEDIEQRNMEYRQIPTSA